MYEIIQKNWHSQTGHRWQYKRHTHFACLIP